MSTTMPPPGLPVALLPRESVVAADSLLDDAVGVFAGGERTEVTVAEPARKVLLVEDERHIRDLVVLHLELEGCETIAVGNGEEGLRLLREQRFDLVVLDLMLPGLDGLTVLRALRREPQNADVPVLLLTARREETDKVLGLETGADDYLTKPFGVRELVARARALMRRPRLPRLAGDGVGRLDQEPIRFYHVTIDPARRRVTAGDHDVELTAREFDLLMLLATHPGIVFSREALLARVWKGEAFVTERSVDTLIKRIRRKIERDPANPTLILTVWGSGYKAADV
jgi:two-component system, OmpR family, alkaline phosphatase synthesis response regulator PhoP